MIAIQDVNAAADETENAEVQMEVTPLSTASEVLRNDYNLDADASNATLTIRTEREMIPNIVETFVRHEIKIYQISTTTSTLEDKFFDLIGENTIE